MLLLQNLFGAIEQLWANKLRSVLTLLGVVIGISSVIAVVTFINGINSYVAEKIFTLFIPLRVGAVVHFGESIATIREDLAEVSPTIFLGVPRIWEKLRAALQAKGLTDPGALPDEAKAATRVQLGLDQAELGMEAYPEFGRGSQSL